jgi:hypothetical protein
MKTLYFVVALCLSSYPLLVYSEALETPAGLGTDFKALHNVERPTPLTDHELSTIQGAAAEVFNPSGPFQLVTTPAGNVITRYDTGEFAHFGQGAINANAPPQGYHYITTPNGLFRSVGP